MSKIHRVFFFFWLRCRESTRYQQAGASEGKCSEAVDVDGYTMIVNKKHGLPFVT